MDLIFNASTRNDEKRVDRILRCVTGFRAVRRELNAETKRFSNRERRRRLIVPMLNVNVYTAVGKSIPPRSWTHCSAARNETSIGVRYGVVIRQTFTTIVLFVRPPRDVHGGNSVKIFEKIRPVFALEKHLRK